MWCYISKELHFAETMGRMVSWVKESRLSYRGSFLPCFNNLEADSTSGKILPTQHFVPIGLFIYKHQEFERNINVAKLKVLI